MNRVPVKRAYISKIYIVKQELQDKGLYHIVLDLRMSDGRIFKFVDTEELTHENARAKATAIQNEI